MPFCACTITRQLQWTLITPLHTTCKTCNLLQIPRFLLHRRRILAASHYIVMIHMHEFQLKGDCLAVDDKIDFESNVYTSHWSLMLFQTCMTCVLLWNTIAFSIFEHTMKVNGVQSCLGRNILHNILCFTEVSHTDLRCSLFPLSSLS